MNYEEKYKEIVGQLKKAYLYAQTDSTKAVLKEIFPELGESEDEKIRKEIVRFIQMEVEDEIVGNKWLAWLGKQKGNICGISANSAWSEEDSFRTETLISVIKSGGSIRPELRNEFVNWLKSLRPQNRWKPTNEQMGCLSDAIEHYNSLGYPAPKLKELLADLKKIKEGEDENWF